MQSHGRYDRCERSVLQFPLLAAAAPSHVVVLDLAQPSAEPRALALPRGAPPVTAAAFHAHVRARLLVGAGAQVLVYDVGARAGARVVEVDERGGSVVAVASSPFSKTLVAVGMSAGSVCLIDLEKEKEKR